MFSSFGHIARLTRTVFVLARYDLLIPHEMLEDMPTHVKTRTRRFGRLARLTARKKNTLKALDIRAAEAIEKLGPAYVKFGQVMATRGDIVGPDLARALSVLQDRMVPFAKEEAEAIIERQLKKPVDELFTSFSKPVAAASVAQVHRAEVVEDGETRVVAVKVLRPGIEEVFRRDLEAMAFAAKWIYRLFPKARRLEPQKFVEVLARSVAEEMDLRSEAAACSELGENTADRKAFVVPQVHWDYTAKGVLTTSWIEGTPLSNIMALNAEGFDLEALGTLVVQSFMTQALMDGYFHADMHQGNLFACKGEPGGEPEVILAAVDFGIMGRLDEPTRNYLADILMGFLIGDYDGISRAHIDAGYVPRDVDMKEFSLALRAIGEPLLGRTADQIPMARLLGHLMQTTERFDMHLQPQLVLLQKTMVVVEGVARALSPGYDMWETARPVIERFMMERRGPEAMIRETLSGAQSLLATLRKAPAVLAESARQIEALGQMTDGGLKLHPETLAAMGAAEAAGTRRAVRYWLAAGAAVVLLFLHLI